MTRADARVITQAVIPQGDTTWADAVPSYGLRTPPRCRPPENGAILAAALRRRPSSIQAWIASGSAPALRHSPATCRANGSRARHRTALLVFGEITPPGVVPRLPGQLRYEDTVSLWAIIEHTF